MAYEFLIYVSTLKISHIYFFFIGVVTAYAFILMAELAIVRQNVNSAFDN